MAGTMLVPPRRPQMLMDPQECGHPLDARRLGGRAGVTIVCMQCGCRAESSSGGATEARGRIQ